MKLLTIVLALLVVSQAAIDADLVTGLEDLLHYDQPWYSGMLQLSDQHSIHYWFFPSQNNATTDPLLLWLNGGPGCSSLLGAMQEHGPFTFEANSTNIVYNDYAWNKNASVIYFESPPGVGFSETKDFTWNDTKTAQVNLQAVLKWFEGYSEFKKHKFFISGESYAGMYVPYLATAIDEYNKGQAADTKINLIGIAIGNGCTHKTECSLGYEPEPYLADTMYSHGMYTPELRAQFLHDCQDLASSECNATFDKIAENLGTGNNQANIYDLIGLCYHQSLPGVHGQAQWKHKKFNQRRRNLLVEEGAEEQGKNDIEGLPPCTDGIGPMLLFNNDTVKEKLHVNKDTEWFMCVGGDWSYDRFENGSYSLYPNLIKQGYRIWKYSGDTDGAVPTTGTLYWIDLIRKDLGLSTIVNWRGWYTNPVADDPNPNNRQNAGQFWRMDGLTLVIFKGVGHMVPQYNRIGGLDMINAFMAGKDLPSQ